MAEKPKEVKFINKITKEKVSFNAKAKSGKSVRVIFHRRLRTKQESVPDRRKRLYKEIQKHRKTCKKWGKDFCFECFGGGITQYTDKLLGEFCELLGEGYYE